MREITRALLSLCAAAGLFLALPYVIWFESLRFTSIASSTGLVSLQPLFSLALERVFLHSKLKATAISGCAIALAGCVIIGAGDFQISGRGLVGDVMLEIVDSRLKISGLEMWR